MDDQRVVLRSVFGFEDTLRSDRVEGVGGEAVDGFGGHTHDLTGAEDLGGGFEDGTGMGLREFGDGVLQVGGTVGDSGGIDGLE